MVTFALTKGRQQIGEIGNDPKNPDSGEYRMEWTEHQELFAEIIFSDVSKESKRLTVEVLEEYKSPQYKKSAAKVNALPKKQEEKNEQGKCICKELYKDLVWGEKVSCEFRKKVIKIAKELWPNNYMNMASELMICMAVETGERFSPSYGYPNATGLIQFTGSAISDMNRTGYNGGKKIDKIYLKSLTAEKQLDYVKLYFQMWMIHYNKTINNALDMYLTIWCPAATGKDDSYVCYSEEKDKADDVTYYEDNKSIEYEYYDESEPIVRKRLKKNLKLANKRIEKKDLKPRFRFWTVLGKEYKIKTFSCTIQETPTQKGTKGKWHDPVNNPMCTIFTQNQTGGVFNDAGKHWGLFGKTRGSSTHYGLDLFALPGTPIFACVKCKVHKIITDENVPKGYGKQIFLKVLDKETFLAHYEKYSELYPNLEHETIGSFSKEKDIILHYAHLRKIYVKEGWTITNVNVPIGETGVSGVIQGGKPNGTCAPHLHFEIRNMNKERINPGFFIRFKGYDKMTDSEKKFQQSTAKSGKIYEFNGVKDTYKNENNYE